MGNGAVQYPRTSRLPHGTYNDRDEAFHIVVRALKDTAPFVGVPGQRVWDVVTGETRRDSIWLLAACLMPDHLHVICRPNARSIIGWMNGFKSFSTRAAAGTGRQRMIWQPSFYDRRLRDEDEVVGAVQYVVENPVVAGLVGLVGEWPWTMVGKDYGWALHEGWHAPGDSS